jgi:hypothetical protein
MFDVARSKVESLDRYLESHLNDSSGVSALATRAREYLASFRWCGQVSGVYVGAAVPPMLGLFLVEIVPTSPDVDRWLWVVVGDLPPAYLVTDDAPDSAGALEAYDSEMSAWVHAVRALTS